MLGTEGRDGVRHLLDGSVRVDGRCDQAEPCLVRIPAAKLHQHTIAVSTCAQASNGWSGSPTKVTITTPACARDAGAMSTERPAQPKGGVATRVCLLQAST